MSHKSFEYLPRNKILSLPSTSTLSKWVEKLDCKPGFNNNVLKIVEKKLQSLESWEKDAIIMFDELDPKKRSITSTNRSTLATRNCNVSVDDLF